MANRFKDFTSPFDSRHDHTVELLEQDGVTAMLYRPNVSDGFTQELSDPVFVRKILVVISEENSENAGGRDKRTPLSIYNGLTNYKDLRLDDILKIDFISYTVTFIDKTPIGNIQFILEKLENDE